MESEVQDFLTPLTRDLRKASATLSAMEARFLVDTYYLMQNQRIRSANQSRALEKSGEPHEVIAWLLAQNSTLEEAIKSVLGVYAKSKPLGRWALSICGIGPVITAGLMAHIDVTKPTVGHVWRFAGLDPTSHWNKGETRPWNAALKTLCWKIGESFVKVQSRATDIYGKAYAERKKYEWEKNLSGEYASQAADCLEQRNFGEDTKARGWYEGRVDPDHARKLMASGIGWEHVPFDQASHPRQMLPPAHIHARACRWAVKRFLYDYWFVGHFIETGKLGPLPWVIEHGGHVHWDEPPHAELVEGLADTLKQRRTA